MILHMLFKNVIFLSVKKIFLNVPIAEYIALPAPKRPTNAWWIYHMPGVARRTLFSCTFFVYSIPRALCTTVVL